MRFSTVRRMRSRFSSLSWDIQPKALAFRQSPESPSASSRAFSRDAGGKSRPEPPELRRAAILLCRPQRRRRSARMVSDAITHRLRDGPDRNRREATTAGLRGCARSEAAAAASRPVALGWIVPASGLHSKRRIGRHARRVVRFVWSRIVHAASPDAKSVASAGRRRPEIAWH